MGGAIDPSSVKVVEVQDEDPRIFVNQVLSGLPMLSASAAEVVPFIHGITDFILRNETGGDSFFWHYVARSEDELHTHLKKQTTGKGFKHDHPLIGKSISDSLRSYPKLQKLYHGR